jgi:hypothetical protein
MDWRMRVTAILLAGGSLAACGGSPPTEGVDSPQAEQPRKGEPRLVPLEPLPRPSASQVQPRYGVPLCNANPDPCCRFPQAPECRAPARAVDDAEAPPWWNAPE